MGLPLKRLESLAHRELCLLLANDSKNKGLNNITVTELRITNDLSFMTIYFTCFDQSKVGSAIKTLEDSKSFLRRELARKIKARKMPELIFKFDEALAYGNKINSILATLDIKKEEE